MKRIWMRVGMDIELTDEEYEELLQADNDRNYIKLEKIIHHMIEVGEPSGETYIIGKECGGVDDYDNPDEEISVLF